MSRAGRQLNLTFAASLALFSGAKAELAVPQGPEVRLVIHESDAGLDITGTLPDQLPAQLLVRCVAPAQSLMIVPINNLTTSYYAFDKDGVPTIDLAATPAPSAAEKVNTLKRLMLELGSRQLTDLSPAVLCDGDRPNRGAAITAMRHIVGEPRELDI